MIVNPAVIGLASKPAWAEQEALRESIALLVASSPGIRVARATVLELRPVQHAPPGPQPVDDDAGFWPVGESASALILSLSSNDLVGDPAPTVAAHFECKHAAFTREHRFLDVMHARRGSLARFGPNKRRDGLSRADFGDHWSTTHAPLVIRKGPLFRRYSAFVLEPDDPADFDGVVMQWFDSVEDWKEHDRLVRDEKPEVLQDISTFSKSSVQFSATLVTFVDEESGLPAR